MFLVSCGGIISGMNAKIPQLTSLAVKLIKVGVPVLLIIFGMLDLGKAVVAQKEDEIKNSQRLFLKRILSAALVFFVIFIVQLVFSMVADGEGEDKGVWDCVDCFINNNCSAK